MFTNRFRMSAVRTAGRFAAPAAWGKRVDTCGFYPLNSRFPLFLNLAQTRDRRPLRKWGTTEDFFFRRGAQCAPISLPLRSAKYRTATHIGYSLQARHKVNCPKGKRRCPGGRPRRTICQPSASCLTVVAQETTGLPYDIICANYLHSLSPCVHFQFSILNFPFYTHKKEESSRFPLARYSLLYPLGVTIASSGVPAAQSGQALPRTKF